MPFGPDCSELVPLSLLPQPRRPGLLKLLVALGWPAAVAAVAAPGAVATFLVCAGLPSGSCPVPGWFFLGWPALFLFWPCCPCLLRLLAVLGPPAVAPSAAAAAAPTTATSSSACVLMSRSCTIALGLVLRLLLALLPLTIAPGLVIPRHLRLSCPGCVDHGCCRSPLRDDRHAESCRPQPVLPWAQWPMAFSRPSSPSFLPC